MSIDRLIPKDLQKLLIEHGYDLGSYGADGVWGGKTSAAIEQWFGIGADLLKPPPEPTPGNIVPADWMPSCSMQRVICHWVASAYDVSAEAKDDYHIIVGGNLVLVRGNYSIKANVSTSDADGYAAHCKGFNTGSIGISAACMAGAKESPFNPGPYPLTKDQWLTLAQVAAELCRRYSIKVTPTTVLQHGEVEKNCGKPQDGKWDITKLPWEPSWSKAQACDAWRSEVQRRI